MKFLAAIVRLYTLAIVLRAIFSWLPGRHQQNVFSKFLYDITEPALRPVRRMLPRSGGIDFSPIVVIILLQILLQVLMDAL
ncbi:MAG: YggT family protein [Planctomycetes bacterium]|nr:YggT family protein [Planctomycetota bacterium]